jgi:hypothetical protein
LLSIWGVPRKYKLSIDNVYPLLVELFYIGFLQKSRDGLNKANSENKKVWEEG